MSQPVDPPLPDSTIEWQDGTPVADPADPVDGGDTRPWYQRRGPLLAVVLGAVAVLVVGWLLIFNGSDEPSASPVTVLRIERVDEFGEPLARELTVVVAGADGDEDEFVWLLPVGLRPSQPAIEATSASTGRAEFRWGPSGDVVDPDQWTSDAVVFEEFGSAESLGAREFECTYERNGEPEGRAVLRVSFLDGGDLRAPRTAVYRFAGYRFEGGDVTTCVIANGGVAAGDGSVTVETGVTPALPTTTLPTDSTLPTESTLPTGSTTPTETTEPGTTEPGSTQPGTTTPTSSTQPGTTQPPVAQSLMDVIDARPEFSALSDLIDFAGLRETFADPAATLTVFAPNNDALIANDLVPELLDTSERELVRELLLTHVHRGDALMSTQLLALAEITVEFSGPWQIDAESDPPTIDVVDIVGFDVSAGNGVLHELDDVIFP